MLEYLRNASNKPVAKVLMFILMFSFVIWGAANWIFGAVTNDTTVIHVGDSDISVQQFNNEKSRQMSAMSKEDLRAVYTDPAKASELNNSVMATLTMNHLALNRAKDLGFVVSDKRIAKEIQSYPEFQSNGKFQPWLFDMNLERAGIDEKIFADYLRSDLLRQMAVGAASVPVEVSQFAVDAMYNARYAKRDIKYVAVKFADFKVATPTEDQLKSYYEQHPVVVPETRSVSYLFVPADMSKPDEYDEGFQKTQKIEDLIISGESIKDAADKMKVKFVKVPAFAFGAKLSDEILSSNDLMAKIFAMEPESESEILELKKGFAILRVDSVNKEHNAEFADVKKSLASDWQKAEQRKNAYVRANELLVDLNKDGSLTGAKASTVSRTEGAPLVVLNAAFAGKNGDNTITEDKDAFYVLHIDKSIAPKSDAKKKEELRKELNNMSNRYVMDDYSQFLKRTYPVRINEKTYRKFIGK